MKVNKVRITRVGKPGNVTCDQVGDDTITGGHGGWEQLSRARRTAMTVWRETPAVVWQIPVILDEVDTGGTVEADCRTLETWGMRGAADTPPVLLVDAPSGRQPAGSRWVLQEISWGDQERDARGVRVQQYATLTLLQYVPGKVLKGPAAKSRDNRKPHKWVPISDKNRRCKLCQRPRDDKRHINRGNE